jgi:hypothetical protein
MKSRKPLLLATLMLCVAVGAINGCRTVTPPPVNDYVVSFDGGHQNGGWLGFHTNAAGEAFCVITPAAKARYDGLAVKWGKAYAAPVKPGDGCQPFTNGTWLIDLEHNVKAIEMNWWNKSKPLNQ